MVTVPAVEPVTVPAITEALVLLAPQVPPVIAGVRVVVPDTHTDELPDKVPASGNG